MEVKLKISGALRELARAGDGPFAVEGDATVAALLRALGLDQVNPLLVVVDSRLARADEMLTDGAEVHLLLGASGG